MNSGYLFSSGTTSERVEVEHYDPYNNTWTLTCPALKYVTNFTATACHGKLYVIGSCAVKFNALTMQCYNPVIGEDGCLSRFFLLTDNVLKTRKNCDENACRNFD